MTTETQTDPQWYFAFRQIVPHPPGHWVPCGPYSSYEETKMEREKSKAFDAEVSVPFVANNIEDARKKCSTENF